MQFAGINLSEASKANDIYLGFSKLFKGVVIFDSEGINKTIL